MSDIIDFKSRLTVTPPATVPAETLDELQHIIAAVRETGEIDANMRARFMIYALPLFGDGWQLHYTG